MAGFTTGIIMSGKEKGLVTLGRTQVPGRQPSGHICDGQVCKCQVGVKTKGGK